MTKSAQLDETLKKLRDIEFALNVSTIVSITDKDGVIQFANDKFCEISGYSREELIGKKQSLVNSGYHPKSFFRNLWNTIQSGKVWRGEIKNKAKDGSHYWVDTTIVPFLNERGEPYQYISIRHDITTRKKYEEYIESMAYFDSLTKLPNRNQLSKWVERHVHLKAAGKSFTVLFLDIDHFVAINDNFGHYIGDRVLQEIAARIRKNLRKTDFASRQGGDEFIIILANNDQEEEAEQIAENLLQSIRAPFNVEDKEITITASIGICHETFGSTILNGKHFIDSLIRKADIAMYHTKKKGGNGYHFSTPYQNIEMERSFLIEQNVNHALKNDEFYIVYQPIVNLRNNQMIGVESLLRWHHPELGHISPGEFIPILERTGQIVQVGRWILWTVCNQMKLWQTKGIFLEKVSVNVAPVQLKDPNFVQDLQKILNETELDASYLELEITEGTIIEIENAVQLLKQLQQLGVKISIDDFGTGYSSLSYLKKLPIDTLKIDKSFINDLDRDGKIIVNTIISMSKNLRYRVVAEGIETKEHLEYLKQQKCHEGQGFYFSKPMKHDEIPKIYALEN